MCIVAFLVRFPRETVWKHQNLEKQNTHKKLVGGTFNGFRDHEVFSVSVVVLACSLPSPTVGIGINNVCETQLVESIVVYFEILTHISYLFYYSCRFGMCAA